MVVYRGRDRGRGVPRVDCRQTRGRMDGGPGAKTLATVASLPLNGGGGDGTRGVEPERGRVRPREPSSLKTGRPWQRRGERDEKNTHDTRRLTDRLCRDHRGQPARRLASWTASLNAARSIRGHPSPPSSLLIPFDTRFAHTRTHAHTRTETYRNAVETVRELARRAERGLSSAGREEHQHVTQRRGGNRCGGAW